jgi:hypothetical protein
MDEASTSDLHDTLRTLRWHVRGKTDASVIALLRHVARQAREMSHADFTALCERAQSICLSMRAITCTVSASHLVGLLQRDNEELVELASRVIAAVSGQVRLAMYLLPNRQGEHTQTFTFPRPCGDPLEVRIQEYDMECAR